VEEALECGAVIEDYRLSAGIRENRQISMIQ
jgi:hypothetical protein